MGHRFEVRKASPADLPDIVAIERRCFDDPWSAQSFRAIMAGVGLVATIESRVVAYVFAARVGDEAEILNVAVDPAERRNGIGRELVRKAVSDLEAAGAKTVYLEVRASNREARMLYGDLDFIEVGRRQKYYRRPPEDAIVMARESTGLRGPR